MSAKPVTPAQFDAGRRIPWLRAAYYHADMVANTIAGAGSDGNVTRPARSEADRPDALLGGDLAIDVVPDTPRSLQAHLDRPYISAREQLLTYEPPTREFLAEIFEH